MAADPLLGMSGWTASRPHRELSRARTYLVLADAGRPTGLTAPCNSPLKNRCVSGSVLSTIDPSMPRMSSTL
jgi:hypothetical protein